MRVVHEVHATIGLERAHMQIAPQLADRVDADHLAKGLELVEVWMNLARGGEELTRERAREIALADALRAVEEVRVRGTEALARRRRLEAVRALPGRPSPLGERGGEEALRLCLLAKGLEGGRGHGRRSPRVRSHRLRWRP